MVRKQLEQPARGGNVNPKSIEARLSRVEARHAAYRRNRKPHTTMRQTVEQYGDVFIEAAAEYDGETVTMEDLLAQADEYDALPVKPTLEDLMKELSEV